MKNLYIFFAVSFCMLGHAQIVNIPDPVFKNYLVNTHCTDIDAGDYTINGDVDANDDGEIQLSEALAVKVLEFEGMGDIDLTGLNAFSNLEFIYFVNVDHLNLDLSGIPSLQTLAIHTGNIASLNVSGLVNLKNINASFCTFPVTDFSTLSALEEFSLWQCTIPSLDLSGLSTLKSIWVEGPEGNNNTILTNVGLDGLTHLETLKVANLGLTTLDLSDMNNLTGLSCFQNQLTSLDVSHLSQLRYIECGSNLLTTLDVTNLTGLESLACEKNQMTALDITQNPGLMYLYCHENQLTALDLSHASNLRMLYCGQNQLTELNTTNLLKLRYIGASSNLFTSLDFSHGLGDTWNDLNFSNNPNLTYLNVKNGAHFWFHQGESFRAANCPNLQYICANEFNFDYINVPQAQVSSYCSFTPGGAFNTISGKLTFDLNNNGCDAGDVLSLNSKMKISTQFTNGISFADPDGNYTFYTEAGNFTVTPDFENPYFTVSPASATVSFSTADNLSATANFCITPNGTHNDAEIVIISTQGPQPGFDAGYRLVYKNKGNQTLSGTVSLTFSDDVLDLISASPMPDNQVPNTLHWNYQNLLPFETRNIDFIMNVNSPQETPSVNLGDVLHFSASIDPVAGDDTPADNTFTLAQTVASSYDPNDKTCLEGTNIDPEMIGGYLHYVIRFQNKGTAAAENVVVKDVIDTQKFDIGSFQFLTSSHPQLTRMSGNKIEFIFENIQLPAEQDDEPGSHGFVMFKIKTKNTLPVGASVSNKADIYFDYNFPITTNTATSVFQLLSRDRFENVSVAVYPNPVKDILNIAAQDNIKSIMLFDVSGRKISHELLNERSANLDISQKAGGVYFVQITTDNSTVTEKIIKQ